MKILVDGNLIDTTMIYRIGKCVHTMDNGYCFYIFFIGKDNYIFIKAKEYNEFQYEAKDRIRGLQEKYNEQLDRLRDELVKLWLGNQTDIPTLKLED